MGSNTYLGGNTVINGGWTWSGKSGLSRPKRKTASQIEAYPSQDDRHLSEILAILDKEEPEFRT